MSLDVSSPFIYHKKWRNKQYSSKDDIRSIAANTGRYRLAKRKMADYE